MQISKIEVDVQIAVPRDIGGNIKQLANDPTYRVAWDFILNALCRRSRLSYVPGNGDARELMIWFEGRRFVGEELMRIAETPMSDKEEPEKPARTMVARQERRARGKTARG